MSRKAKEKQESTKENRKETFVYIGPEIKNVVRKNFFFIGEPTPGLAELLEEIPRTADLIVPLSEFTSALKELKTKGSPRALSYNFVQKNAKGRR